MGRTPPGRWADVVISKALCRPEHSPVQLIASPRVARVPIGAAIVGTLVGVALLSGGLFLGWLTFATPLVSRLTPDAIRPTISQMAVGGVVWGVALIGPPVLAIVGAWRLSRVVRALATRPATRVLTRASAELGDEYFAASDIRLPEGRAIRDLVVGPFGLAVLAELPPPRYVRRTGTSWETRAPNGRWIHMENPLERAARDAERVRRWFASTERDYVIKVFAALVTSDPQIARTPTCAVVSMEQVPAWLASLPASRALNPDRRGEVVEQIRGLL
jgi:hypothetical protein